MRSHSHKDFLRSQTVIKRRKKRRLVRFWILVFSAVAFLALLAWVASRPGMLIKRVVVVGNAHISSSDIQSVADTILDDKYIHLFSKRNALIYPKSDVKAAILSAYPRILDLALYTESFEVLNIKIQEREASAVWCAAVKCYLVDGNSYIYAEKQDYPDSLSASVNISVPDAPDENSGSSTVTGSEAGATSTGRAAGSRLGASVAPTSLLQAEYDALPVLYGGDDVIGPEPVGKSVFNPKLFNDLLVSVKEIEKLGGNFKIKDVHVFSRDEIVFDLAHGGKIIFADRKPFSQSIDDLKSALKSPVFSSSTDPQFEYVDTRFGNKVFYRLKNAGESSITSTTSKSNI